jgi:chemotaxis protein MotB
MAGKDEPRPIYVKRKKVVAGGHHGGAWKVAYADFVTAMMAFFLVMWLVASVSKEQRAAIFDYFKNPSMEQGSAPKPAPGMHGPGGASSSPINMRGGMDAPRSQPQQPAAIAGAAMMAQAQPAMDGVTAARAVEVEKQERANLDALKRDLEEAIAKSQALAPFKDQLLLDITPEGLRIQIVDAQNRAMFDRGSSQLKDYTARILAELAPYLTTVPNNLSLSGHTDITPYAGEHGFSNWELSAERANAARRALLQGGLAEAKISRVVGLSSAVLFDKKDPASPINRRISIIVMTKKAEEAAHATDDPAHTLSPVSPGAAAQALPAAPAAQAATAQLQPVVPAAAAVSH